MAAKKKRSPISYLPAFGSIATGIIYAAIGVIALLSFFKVRHGGADEGSMLQILNEYIIGKIFIGIILTGTVCYIIWRIYETIKDPYEYGKNLKGLALRTGIALSSVADALIVYSAVRVLLGISGVRPDGSPVEERHMVENLLKQDYNWLVIIIGLIYFVTAIIQLLYGVTSGYKERVNVEKLSVSIRYTVHVLAWAGYFGRGIILGITGFFLLKAGIVEKAEYVVNTDKAFDFIGDQVGHVFFILVAIATLCYGLFMFVQGIKYDTDKD